MWEVEWPGKSYANANCSQAVPLEDDRMLEILRDSIGRNGAGPETPILELLAAANEAGGHDNITAALVRFDSD